MMMMVQMNSDRDACLFRCCCVPIIQWKLYFCYLQRRPNKIKFIMGKVHRLLARVCKVRGQTPKVAKQGKKKQPCGRTHKRIQYNRRLTPN